MIVAVVDADKIARTISRFALLGYRLIDRKGNTLVFEKPDAERAPSGARS